MSSRRSAFAVIDPTTLDRQGPDVGSDYRPIVFARDSAQLGEEAAYVAELTSRRVLTARS